MMGSLRDSQRQRLYDAEQEAFEHPIEAAKIPECAIRTPKVDDCQRYVDRIVGSVWWRERFGTEPVTVADGRGRRSACAWWEADRISLPLSARKRWVILHELAHIAVMRHVNVPYADHGWQFASTYLKLVRRFLGRACFERLRSVFKARKVRYRAPRAGAAPKVSPEEAEARLGRLTAGRAKLAAARAAEEAKDPIEVTVERGNFRDVIGCSLIVGCNGAEVDRSRGSLMTASLAREAAAVAGRKALAAAGPGSVAVAVIEGLWTSPGRKGSETWTFRWK